MRKAALFFNPLSGRRTQRRVADVDEALSVLHAAGIEASACATRGPADAAEQVRLAISQGCDTVFACGGDGTVHDILQGVVGTEAALGIIPMGTANSLAHDLGSPRSPAAAARVALSAIPRKVAVGRINYQSDLGGQNSRFFTVIAGVGVDAHLFYHLNPSMKSRLGMAAYYLHATRLWLTHPMPEFEVELIEKGTSRSVKASQLLAVRIQNFGGMLRELAPGASLERNDFRVVLFRTRKRIAYLNYILRGIMARPGMVAGIESIHSEHVICQPTSAQSRVFVQADGEILGTLPAEISIVPEGFTLLVPGTQ